MFRILLLYCHDQWRILKHVTLASHIKNLVTTEFVHYYLVSATQCFLICIRLLNSSSDNRGSCSHLSSSLVRIRSGGVEMGDRPSQKPMETNGLKVLHFFLLAVELGEICNKEQTRFSLSRTERYICLDHELLISEQL